MTRTIRLGCPVGARIVHDRAGVGATFSCAQSYKSTELDRCAMPDSGMHALPSL